MKTLLQKDLVYEHGRPLKKYALTEEGWEVAKRIRKTLPENQTTLFFGNQPVRYQYLDYVYQESDIPRTHPVPKTPRKVAPDLTIKKAMKTSKHSSTLQ